MYAADSASEDVTSRFKAPDPKVPLSVRAPLSVREKLEAVIRLWRARVEVDPQYKSDDPKKQDELDRLRETARDAIDMSYVMIALLEGGADAEFGESGGYPEDEAAWEALEKSLRKNAKK